MLMPPHIAGIIAADHGRDLRERARHDRAAARRRAAWRARLGERLRREPRGSVPAPALEAAVTIRLARAGDEHALRRLAELDSRRVPAGEVLVASVAGALVAAVPLDGGDALADPFAHTSGLVALLGVRARQLRHPTDLPEPRAAVATRRRPAVAGDR